MEQEEKTERNLEVSECRGDSTGGDSCILDESEACVVKNDIPRIFLLKRKCPTSFRTNLPIRDLLRILTLQVIRKEAYRYLFEKSPFA